MCFICTLLNDIRMELTTIDGFIEFCCKLSTAFVKINSNIMRHTARFNFYTKYLKSKFEIGKMENKLTLHHVLILGHV